MSQEAGSTRMRPLVTGLIALGLLAAQLLLAGCEAVTAPAEENRSRPVQVERVAFQSGGTSRDFVGVVGARTETDLAFRVAGKLAERLVDVGDHVEAGDVVARLDSDDLQLQVDSARAEVSAASSSLRQAAADLNRYSQLKAGGFASNADFDRRTAARDEAEGRLERARRNLDLAENQLAYAELRADADGIVIAAPAEPGEVIAIGRPVVRLARDGSREAVVSLPETWLDQVKQAKASVRLWSDGDRSYSAKLRELSPAADPSTRTYTARFTIQGAGASIALGMTAIVTLSEPTGQRVARLPLAAVFSRGTGSSVYRVDKTGTLELRPVTVAAFTEDAALVTGGVDEGDRIVTLGVHKLEAGERVRTVEAR